MGPIGRPPGAFSLGCLALLAAVAGGCGALGGGEQIPSPDAQALLATVSAIGAATAAEDCEAAQSSTTELRRQVDALPEDVDPEIGEALTRMVSRVDEQLDQECVETGTSDVTTTTEIETTAPTTTTPPATTTEAPPPEEEPTTPPQPPGEGGGPQGPEPTPPGQGGGTPPDTGGVVEERHGGRPG